jgi:hypothetical protein
MQGGGRGEGLGEACSYLHMSSANLSGCVLVWLPLPKRLGAFASQENNRTHDCNPSKPPSALTFMKATT